jgi:hypothetical protein
LLGQGGAGRGKRGEALEGGAARQMDHERYATPNS